MMHDLRILVIKEREAKFVVRGAWPLVAALCVCVCVCARCWSWWSVCAAVSMVVWSK
jgi:hypothetical protein